MRERSLFYFIASCFKKQVAWKIGRGTEFESRLRDLAQGVGEFTCHTDSKMQDFAASAEDPIKLAETEGSRRSIKSRICCLCRRSDEETVVGMMLIASLLHHTRKEKFR